MTTAVLDEPVGLGAAGALLSDPVDELVAALREVDRATARLLRLFADAGGLVRDGLPARRLVGLLALQTGSEIAFLTRAVQVLAAMPRLWEALDRGWVSWSQVRGIVVQARRLSVAQLGVVDDALTGEVARQADGRGEPDRLVEIAGDLVFRLDGARSQAGEDRGMDANGLVAQAGFDGRLSLVGELDAEGGAAVLEALAAAADRPVADGPVTDDEGRPVPRSWLAPTARGGQLAEGLVRIANAFLAGQDGIGETGQARPRVIVVADVADLADVAEMADRADVADVADRADVAGGSVPRGFSGRGWGGGRSSTIGVPLIDPAIGAARGAAGAAAAEAGLAGSKGSVTARILAGVAGGRLRISPLTAQRLACDGQVVVLLTDWEAPVAIGDAHAPISDRLRRAVMARDQGCRMPGCRAAVQWTDVHHVIPREEGGATSIENLVAVCRACHCTIHARGWTLTLDPDGTLHVRHGRYRFVTYPRLRAPALRAGP